MTQFCMHEVTFIPAGPSEVTPDDWALIVKWLRHVSPSLAWECDDRQRISFSHHDGDGMTVSHVEHAMREFAVVMRNFKRGVISAWQDEMLKDAYGPNAVTPLQ